MSDSLFDMVLVELVDEDEDFKGLPLEVRQVIAGRFVDQVLGADVDKPLSVSDAVAFKKGLVEEFCK